MNWFLSVAVFCFVLSIILFAREERVPSLIFLLLGSAALFTYAALLDPFLNVWDERFHALVAKNMLNHPLRPTLYDDLAVPMNYDRWDRYHIWLHKQPLFLWQITASFRLFGVSEFTLRLPSVIQATLMTLLVYRIGRLLVNYRAGFLAAFLFSTSNFMIALVSGKQAVDHNEIAALFYITCSIWAFLEYHKSGKIYFLFLTGIFGGCAFLNKWMIGLVIYLLWLVYIVAMKERKKEILHFLLAFLLTCIVALPWQLFILHTYPEQAMTEYSNMGNHLFLPMDGHHGNWLFYFDHFSQVYYKIPVWIAVFGFFLMYRRIRDARLRIAVILLPVFVYMIFIPAGTKFETYPFIIVSIVYLSVALIIDYFFEDFLFRKSFSSLHPSPGEERPGMRLIRKSIVVLLLLLIGWTNLDLHAITWDHSTTNKENLYSSMLVWNKGIFLKLKETLPEKTVVFNVRGRHYVECMFYTGLTAYNFIPSYGQYCLLKYKHRRIAVFLPGDKPLSAYLSADPDVIKLTDKLQGWD